MQQTIFSGQKIAGKLRVMQERKNLSVFFLLIRNLQALGPSPMVLLQRQEDHFHPTCDLIELVSVTMLVT